MGKQVLGITHLAALHESAVVHDVRLVDVQHAAAGVLDADPRDVLLLHLHAAQQGPDALQLARLRVVAVHRLIGRSGAAGCPLLRALVIGCLQFLQRLAPHALYLPLPSVHGVADPHAAVGLSPRLPVIIEQVGQAGICQFALKGDELGVHGAMK